MKTFLLLAGILWCGFWICRAHRHGVVMDGLFQMTERKEAPVRFWIFYVFWALGAAAGITLLFTDNL